MPQGAYPFVSSCIHVGCDLECNPSGVEITESLSVLTYSVFCCCCALGLVGLTTLAKLVLHQLQAVERPPCAARSVLGVSHAELMATTAHCRLDEPCQSQSVAGYDCCYCNSFDDWAHVIQVMGNLVAVAQPRQCQVSLY